MMKYVYAMPDTKYKCSNAEDEKYNSKAKHLASNNFEL